MPDAAEVRALVRLLDHRQHERAFGQAAHIGVFDHLAEAARQGQQVVRRQHLVAKEDHDVLEQRRAQGRHRPLLEGCCEVDPENLGTERAAQGPHLDSVHGREHLHLPDLSFPFGSLGSFADNHLQSHAELRESRFYLPDMRAMIEVQQSPDRRIRACRAVSPARHSRRPDPPSPEKGQAWLRPAEAPPPLADLVRGTLERELAAAARCSHQVPPRGNPGRSPTPRLRPHQKCVRRPRRERSA